MAEQLHPAFALAGAYPHRVPDDAVVPDGVAVCAFSADSRWMPRLFPDDYRTPAERRHAGLTYWTAEPVESPKPPPLGEIRYAPEGSKYFYAARVDSDHPRLSWVAGHKDGYYNRLCDEDVADWTPARLVPNGNGVMDEDDKRDRVTHGRCRIKWGDRYEAWYVVGTSDRFGTLAALVAYLNVALSFADESTNH